ncbi:MAG: TVP38/TMEM64 family protein [Clostridiaceae bacterium]|nr:TVP38/TMEM64 family protein [Clostridiaceae bacterium]
MKRIWNTIRSKVSKSKQYIVLAAVLLLFIYIGYEYFFKYADIIKDPNLLKEVIHSYGNFSILVFILMHVIQVVIFFIPGEFMQIAGGYIFGTFLGAIFSLIGITLGSLIIYAICNSYGKPFVDKLILNKKVKFFKKILNVGSEKSVVFIFYLIPGIPKDALAYICGVSNISFKDFIIYSTLGRIPGILISSFFGQKIYAWDLTTLIIIGVITGVLSIVGIFKGNTIIKSMIKNKKID